MNFGVNYNLFYEILLNLREIFHSYGRIDDSNAKLDEIIKLIMLSYYEALKGNRFSLIEVKDLAIKLYNDDSQVSPALIELFQEAVKYPKFINDDGTSIFGSNPKLNIQPSENIFAERLIAEIEKIDFLNLVSSHETNSFDIINECFGHFVRDNFRNNKEDAQYMTPAEISEPVISMMFNDMISEGYFENLNLEDFKIMDPTCGVGTLLIESSRKFIDIVNQLDIEKNRREKIIESFLMSGMIGQDKVDRMVRFSKINSILIGGNIENISIGNSISEKSAIDRYIGNIDLIFTNPPFGAEYNTDQLDDLHFSLLSDLNINGQTISSEILLLLKSIALLKPNGRLAIVLPDSVFSAKGINSDVRKLIIDNFSIKSIIELPAVTFAQAGTRTKTSILYLVKKSPSIEQNIIMGICENIGYNVKEKMGVPVKISTGSNDIKEIANVYNKNIGDNDGHILSNSPSVTAINIKELIDGVLNPNFYNAARLSTVTMLESKMVEGFELRSLAEIVRFETIGRKNLLTDDNTKHISVLHVNSDFTINFQDVLNYSPISKGRSCYEGDILFSKINPRIPRMTVIPKYNMSLVCSNEFEILQPCADIDAYTLCLILKSSYVSRQIENLTSGTSSSHSRIKREQLSQIKVPYPISSEAKTTIAEIGKNVKQALELKYQADTTLSEQIQKLEIFKKS